MLQFSPKPTSNLTACDQIHSLLHSRPLPPVWLPQLQLSLLIILQIWFAAQALLWNVWQKHPRLQHQPTLSIYFLNAGCILAFVAFLARDSVIGNDGYPAAFCPLLVCCLLGCGSMLGAGAWMQQILVLRRLKRSKLARQAPIFDAIREESESVVSGGSRTDVSEHGVWDLVVFVIKAGLLIDGGTVGLANELASPYIGSSSRQVGVVAPESTRLASPRDVHKVEQLPTLQKKVLALMILVFALPTIAIMIIIVLATPAHREGCQGCEILAEDVIGAGFMGICWSLVIGRSSFIFLRGIQQGHIVDTYGDWIGVWCGLGFTMGGMVLTIIFLIVDPNLWQNQFLVTWEWFAILGLCLAASVNCLRPLCIVALEKAGISSDKAFVARGHAGMEVLRKELIALCCENDEDFLSYCELRFVVENCRFVAAIQSFRQYFFDKGAVWRRSKAQMLQQLFLEQGAPLEVNCQDKARRRVRELLSGNEVPYEAFDVAYSEVETMLLQDVFLGYVTVRDARAAKAEAESHTHISSKLPFPTQRQGKLEGGNYLATGSISTTKRESIVGGIR